MVEGCSLWVAFSILNILPFLLVAGEQNGTSSGQNGGLSSAFQIFFLLWFSNFDINVNINLDMYMKEHHIYTYNKL